MRVERHISADVKQQNDDGYPARQTPNSEAFSPPLSHTIIFTFSNVAYR